MIITDKGCLVAIITNGASLSTLIKRCKYKGSRKAKSAERKIKKYEKMA